MTTRNYKVTFTHPCFPGKAGNLTVTVESHPNFQRVSAEGFPASDYGTSVEFAIRHFMTAQRAKVITITEIEPEQTRNLHPERKKALADAAIALTAVLPKEMLAQIMNGLLGIEAEPTASDDVAEAGAVLFDELVSQSHEAASLACNA